MRGLGYAVLSLGVIIVAGALSMDVSVSSGLGRVNNIGLIAERQNYIFVGCVMMLIGTIFTIVGIRRQNTTDKQTDYGACPVCAESIKCAALKCKHCGSEVVGITPMACEQRSIEEPIDYDTIKLWVIRGVLLTIFTSIIISSVLREALAP